MEGLALEDLAIDLLKPRHELWTERLLKVAEREGTPNVKGMLGKTSFDVGLLGVGSKPITPRRRLRNVGGACTA